MGAHQKNTLTVDRRRSLHPKWYKLRARRFRLKGGVTRRVTEHTSD
jgi:hypothetical protein